MKSMLAKITDAKLKIKDRGCLSISIHVNYEDGLSQGLGGIVLDEYNQETQKRVGTAYGCEMIRRTLLALDVDDFSEMIGMHIHVLGEGEGFRFSPKGIKMLAVDNIKAKAFIFSELDFMLEGQ